MISLPCFNRRFTPNWQMMILSLLIIVFFIYLGSWQLHRAEEKKAMLLSEAQLAALAPQVFKPGMATPLQYQSVLVSGQYLPEILLLDNQHYQHQFGYHVISPLLLPSKEVILIDRGWVKGYLNRRQLPALTNPQQFLQLSGQVYYPSAKNWVLGQVIEKKSANLAIVELLDTQLISQFLHKSVYPFIIRLHKSQKDGFVCEWDIVSMPPQRHIAYAFQWFAMALVIFIIFISLNLKKIDENS